MPRGTYKLPFALALRQPPLTLNFYPPYTSEEPCQRLPPNARSQKMKSAHRHELQTNELAQKLEIALDRVRPYVSTIVGTIVALAIAFLIWTYVSRSSASEETNAWNAFNEAIGAAPPNLDDLHTSAAEFPGTKMQELADIAWAEGQVYFAAQNYLYNRRQADEALRRATDTLQAIMQSTNDQRLQNRARIGMARVYEMRNDLAKARDEYKKVTGGYKDYAEKQVERLARPEAVATYDWLAKAEPPRSQAPIGPGTPGQRPEFTAGEIALPGESPEGAAPMTGSDTGPSIDDLLKGLRELPTETGTADPTQTGPNPPFTQPSEPTQPPAESGAPNTTPPGDASAPPAEGETPAATGDAPAETTDPPATESNPSPPAESSSTDEKSAE